MKEFGSEFHFMDISSYPEHKMLPIFNKCNLYATGRHALQDLILFKKRKREWKRIWMPEYFCYEVVKAIKETGINVVFYPDSPLANDRHLISQQKFEKGDVLFRMNYFGLRSLRDNSSIPIDVIEDHSHDLCSDWALRSNADWCIASLRKTLPLPEGGVLWSPINEVENIQRKESTIKNEDISNTKLLGMALKRLYIDGSSIDKEDYRKFLQKAEIGLSDSEISGISAFAGKALRKTPIKDLYSLKKCNWIEAKKRLLETGNELLLPENYSTGTPFSIVLKFDCREMRDKVNKALINKNIYPAILWAVPEDASKEIVELSGQLLSIHCDARYSKTENSLMVEILLKVLSDEKIYE